MAPTFGRARAQAPSPQGTRLIDQHTLRSKGIDYHPSYLRTLWRRGDFPKPMKLSPRRLAWREEEIDAWIAGKLRAGEV
jgi:prophage regulatory protein